MITSHLVPGRASCIHMSLDATEHACDMLRTSCAMVANLRFSKGTWHLLQKEIFGHLKGLLTTAGTGNAVQFDQAVKLTQLISTFTTMESCLVDLA